MFADAARRAARCRVRLLIVRRSFDWSAYAHERRVSCGIESCRIHSQYQCPTRSFSFHQASGVGVIGTANPNADCARHDDSSNDPIEEESQSSSSTGIMRVDEKDLSGTTLSEQTDVVKGDPSDDHGSLEEMKNVFGEPRSLAYIRDAKRLEFLVKEMERIDPLVYWHVKTFVHPLMVSTSGLGSQLGAELTERLLGNCLEHVERAFQSSRKALQDGTYDGSASRRRRFPHPNNEMYSLAVTAWTKVGTSSKVYGAHRAEQLLAVIKEEFHRDQALVAAMAQRYGPDSEIVKNHASAPSPDIINYSSVLNAWAKSNTKEGPHRALELLNQMEQISGIKEIASGGKSGVDSSFLGNNPHVLTPDRTCYNTVMSAFAFSSHPRAAFHVEQLFGRLQNLHDATVERGFVADDQFQPDTTSHNMLLHTYARIRPQQTSKKYNRRAKRGDGGAGGQGGNVCGALAAEGVLRRMFKLYEEQTQGEKGPTVWERTGATRGVCPNIKSYNGIIHGWATSHEGFSPEYAARRANAILMALLGKSPPVTPIKTGLEDGGATIGRNSADFGEHFPPILESVDPDTTTFNLTINCWAKSGVPEAGERAEEVLELMKNASGRHGQPLLIQPITMTYNSTMNAWSRSGRPDGAQRAETLLLEAMLGTAATVRPNAISFVTVIHAWGRIKTVDCALRAQAILERQEDYFWERDEDPSVRPTDASYQGVLSAWARVANHGERIQGKYPAEHAEAILWRISPPPPTTTKDNETHRFLELVKTSHCNSILEAWSKHRAEENRDAGSNSSSNITEGEPNRVQRARTLLASMMSTDKCAPNTASFNFVIAACASPMVDAGRRREAFFAAIDTYNRLCASRDCRPDDTTYKHMFEMLRAHLPPARRRRVATEASSPSANVGADNDHVSSLADELFQSCCSEGYLTEAVFRAASSFLPKKNMENLVGGHRAIENDDSVRNSMLMTRRYQDLPPEWSRNVTLRNRKKPSGIANPLLVGWLS